MPGSEEALEHPEEAFSFMTARSAATFDGPVKKIIKTYKDGDELRLDSVIASLVCAAIRGRRWVEWTGHLTQNVAEATRSEEVLPSFLQPPLRDLSAWADVLTYIPASPEAVLRRGFDHMQRVAALCANRCGLPLARLLDVRSGAKDQREFGRAERLENRTQTFALACDAREVPERVLVVDDVFTTGATLNAASKVLLDAGAKEVAVVTCARVW